MNTIRFMNCVLCMYTGFLFSREVSSLPGRTINIYSHNLELALLSREYGFDFHGQGDLVFQIKSCNYGKIVIGYNSSFAENFVTFSYGSSNNDQFITIRYNCYGCYTVYKYINVLSCNEYRHHWIQWAEGIFAFGEGNDASNVSTRILNTAQNPIQVKEIGMASGTRGQSAFFKVVKDNAPSFTFPNLDGSSKIEMVEKRPVNSTVLTVRANDPENDPLIFSVRGRYNTTFYFDGENLKISNILKRDSHDHYQILIRMTDSKNVREVNVTLLVLPLLTRGERIAITEELPLGSMVDSLYKIHDDRTDINYSLLGTDSKFFYMHKTTGKIIVSRRLDREALPYHYLDDLRVVVTTSDGEATASLWININVTDINDNLPKCAPSTSYIEVPENVTLDERLLNISCTDRDPGVNGFITLEILEPTVLKTILNVSTTAIFIQGNALDLETMTSDLHFVSVKVSDSPYHTDPFETTFYFQLKVLGVNEHTPRFTHPILSNGVFYDISVYENVSVGSIIWSVNATDADHGEDGKLTFFLHSVISDKDNNHMVDMTINNDGELMTTRMMDRDSPLNGVLYYNVTIGVRDNGDPSKTSLATLRIDLIDVNDNIPTFKKDAYKLDIPCNASIGDQFDILEVNDLDSTSEITIVAIENTDGFLGVSHDGNITLQKRPSNANSDGERLLRISSMDGKWSAQGFLIYNFEVCPTVTTPSSLMNFTSSGTHMSQRLMPTTSVDMTYSTTEIFYTAETHSVLYSEHVTTNYSDSMQQSMISSNSRSMSSMILDTTFNSTKVEMSGTSDPIFTDPSTSTYSNPSDTSQTSHSLAAGSNADQTSVVARSIVQDDNQTTGDLQSSFSVTRYASQIPVSLESTWSLEPNGHQTSNDVHSPSNTEPIFLSYPTDANESSYSAYISIDSDPSSSTYNHPSSLLSHIYNSTEYSIELKLSSGSLVFESSNVLKSLDELQKSTTFSSSSITQQTMESLTPLEADDNIAYTNISTRDQTPSSSETSDYLNSLEASSVTPSFMYPQLSTSKTQASSISPTTQSTEPTKILATSSRNIIGILEDIGLKGLCIIESTALIVIASVYIYKKWILSKVLPSS